MPFAKGGYRLYVPGYNDAMINTAASYADRSDLDEIQKLSRSMTCGYAGPPVKKEKATWPV